MPEVSCIMPIYNTSRYMDKCIESLLKQTFTDFELIMVEDCSTDDSLLKCEQIEQKDSRVKLIRNEVNKGAAVSRNIGFTYATGKYIIFLDSDDYFYPQMLEICYKKAEENNSDLVIFGYQVYFAVKQNELSERIEKKHANVQENKLIDHSQLKIDDLTKSYGPWNRFVRKKVILDNHIMFQDIPNSNDIYYSCLVILYSQKICFIDDILVDYIVRTDGITSIREKNKTYFYQAELEVLKELVEHFTNRKDLIDGLINYNCFRFINDMISDKLTYEYKLKVIDDFKNIVYYIQMRKQMGDIFKLSSRSKTLIRYILEGKNVIGKNIYSYTALETIEELKKRGKRLALWGCGRYGKLLIDALEDSNIRIDHVIDMDINKQGTYYESYLIENFDDIYNDIDNILITNMKFYDEIHKKANGISIIYVQ